MKITINRAAVLDGIYAETSLRSAITAAPGGYVSRLLTRSHDAALRRLLDDAVAIALARLGAGWRLDALDSLTITIDGPDDLLLDSTTAGALLPVALGHLCTAVILGTCAAGGEGDHRVVACSILDSLGRRRVALCSTQGCY